MELRVGGKYRLDRKIGNGAFGEIYLGANTQTNSEVAIKLEGAAARHPQLLLEYRLYRWLQGGAGIPDVYWYGVEGEYNVLVLELLGPSLEDLFNYCKRQFSLKTVLMLADQMMSRVEYLHAKNFIHRDVKPDNFLIGLSKKANQVHLIDFGLCKRYRDAKTQQHIPHYEGKSLTGTARYASINTHMGIEQSRRDDIEGLMYCLVYFLKGSLPWQGLRGSNKQGKYGRILERKQGISVEALCSELPPEFCTCLCYVRALRFEERPDYSYIKRLLKDLFFRENQEYDFIFDWTLLNMTKRERQRKTNLNEDA